MDLQDTKKITLSHLLLLIENGSELRDEIERQYRSKRADQVLQCEDIEQWRSKYSEWFRSCLTTLASIFEPSIIIVNKFKDAPIDATYPAGENVHWSGLIKHLTMRLRMLGDLYETVSLMKDSELSEYGLEAEVNVGVAKIKLDKFIGKLGRKLWS